MSFIVWFLSHARLGAVHKLRHAWRALFRSRFTPPPSRSRHANGFLRFWPPSVTVMRHAHPFPYIWLYRHLWCPNAHHTHAIYHSACSYTPPLYLSVILISSASLSIMSLSRATQRSSITMGGHPDKMTAFSGALSRNSFTFSWSMGATRKSLVFAITNTFGEQIHVSHVCHMPLYSFRYTHITQFYSSVILMLSDSSACSSSMSLPPAIQRSSTTVGSAPDKITPFGDKKQPTRAQCWRREHEIEKIISCTVLGSVREGRCSKEIISWSVLVLSSQ